MMKLGIFGGGQLGRMTALSAAHLGISSHIYCPDADSPAFAVAAHSTCAPYEDLEAVAQFAKSVDVITFEFENVPQIALQEAERFASLRPNAQALYLSQNRVREKRFAQDCGVPTAPFHPVNHREDWQEALRLIGTPSVLKTQELGYDGKGQWRIHSEEEAKHACEQLSVPGILEGWVSFECEVSAVVARGVNGQMACFPISQNRHESGVLRSTLAPAPLPPVLLAQAEAHTRRLAEEAQVVGLLAVEYFVTPEGELLFNEMAPRPHNSGHWTMDGCYVSQFEQLVRAVCGLPLADPQAHSTVEMFNILGDEVLRRDEIVANPSARWYDYGKTAIKPGRKMGHFNLPRPLPAELLPSGRGT